MNYNHLTINERCCIFQFKQSGMSIRQIAKALKRNASTISREIKRNSTEFGSRGRFKRYLPKAAQVKSEERREKCHRSNNEYSLEVKEYIMGKLLDHWSPEQIAHRECEYNLPSTSTIYRMIHRDDLKRVKMENLRRKGRFKRPAETRGCLMPVHRLKRGRKVYINAKSWAIGKPIQWNQAELIISVKAAIVL